MRTSVCTYIPYAAQIWGKRLQSVPFFKDKYVCMARRSDCVYEGTVAYLSLFSRTHEFWCIPHWVFAVIITGKAVYVELIPLWKNFNDLKRGRILWTVSFYPEHLNEWQYHRWFFFPDGKDRIYRMKQKCGYQLVYCICILFIYLYKLRVKFAADA